MPRKTARTSTYSSYLVFMVHSSKDTQGTNREELTMPNLKKHDEISELLHIAIEYIDWADKERWSRWWGSARTKAGSPPSKKSTTVSSSRVETCRLFDRDEGRTRCVAEEAEGTSEHLFDCVVFYTPSTTKTNKANNNSPKTKNNCNNMPGVCNIRQTEEVNAVATALIFFYASRTRFWAMRALQSFTSSPWSSPNAPLPIKTAISTPACLDGRVVRFRVKRHPVLPHLVHEPQGPFPLESIGASPDGRVEGHHGRRHADRPHFVQHLQRFVPLAAVYERGYRGRVRKNADRNACFRHFPQ